jgi:ubiquinone/menaquinone biosynthesis C-methylase UbiE
MKQRPGKAPRKSDRKGSIRTDWSPVADWYDELVGDSGSEYHQKIVIPGVLRLLGPVKDERMIDIACGQGVLCRALHERGIRVTGADAAVELIRAARDRGPAEIHYEVADATNLSNFADGKFDAAVCMLAIQNIHPLAPVFSSIGRILKPGEGAVSAGGSVFDSAEDADRYASGIESGSIYVGVSSADQRVCEGDEPGWIDDGCDGGVVEP